MTAAAGDATVGSAIDELLTLHYSKQPTTDTAEGGRHRAPQRAFGTQNHATEELRTRQESRGSRFALTLRTEEGREVEI